MTTRRSLAGFSLAEMAITLLIITLLTSGALMALRVQTERSRFTQTQAALLEAKQALLAFAATQGRLPCPAVADPKKITTATSGVEDCSIDQRGLVPWKTLGIQGVDAWDQYLVYQVTVKLADPAKLDLKTITTGTVAVRDAFSSTASKSGDSDTDPNAFAIWSQGANGNGAITVQNTAKTASTNADEMANAPASFKTPLQVVLHTQTDSFDDTGLSVSRYVLFKQMIDAGISIPHP